MKVLLTNIHSLNNAGDHVLMSESIHQIKNNFGPDAAITLVMDDPSSEPPGYDKVLSTLGWLLQTSQDGFTRLNLIRMISLPFRVLLPTLIYRLSGRFPWWMCPPPLHPLLRGYLNSQVVISTAGGFLYSSGRGTTLLIRLFSLWLAYLLRKPFYLLPQSIGPFSRPWECRAVRYVLSKARLIMVREPISLKQLQACGVQGPKLKLVPDLGFGFAGASPAELEEWCRQNQMEFPRDTPALGVTVINWGGQYRAFQNQAIYEQSCAQAVETFITASGGRVYFFPQVFGPTRSQDDRLISTRIASRLSHLSEKVVLITQPIPPAVLKSLYGRMTIFLGTRMHSNIFALSAGTPVLAIGYLHKTAGIMQMLDLEHWVVDINTADAEVLKSRLLELLAQRTQVAAAIQAKLPEISTRLDQAGRLIYSDYANWESKEHA